MRSFKRIATQTATRIVIASSAIASVMLFAQTANAHLAHTHLAGGVTNGWLAGFLHPFLGVDHLLAMVAIGLWASQLSQLKRGPIAWVPIVWLPIAFVGTMTLSAGLAHTGVILPWVEQSIILSNIVLGLLIFYSAQLPVNVGITLAGILAIAHGYAHGTEIPMGASALDYGLGFVAATVMLHGMGVAIGLGLTTLSRSTQTNAFRLAGTLILGGTLYALATI